jgi:hypothetical protein
VSDQSPVLLLLLFLFVGFGIFGFPIGENTGTAYCRFGSAVFVLFWLEFFSGIGSRFLFDVLIDIKGPFSFSSGCGICCVCFEIGLIAPCFFCALFE